jgi:hypothetical protein
MPGTTSTHLNLSLDIRGLIINRVISSSSIIDLKVTDRVLGEVQGKDKAIMRIRTNSKAMLPSRITNTRGSTPVEWSGPSLMDNIR